MPLRLFCLLLLVLLPLAAARADNGAVLLIYHHFGDARFPSTNIPLTQFDAQLDYLAKHHYTVWPVAKIVRHLREHKPLPPHTVGITIDDAYTSVYTNAFPRLKTRGWPFTVFVSTDYIDKGYHNYMSWAQMREMKASGDVSFGDHSLTHRHMVLPVEAAEDWDKVMTAEIVQAQKRLQQELGADTNTDPPLFAYPFGEYSKTLADLVQKLGFVGLGQHSGAVDFASDLRELPRYPMAGAYAEMPSFIQKVQTRALDIAKVTPWDPLTAERRPVMQAQLADPALADALTCFVSGEGRTAVQWVDKAKGIFTVQAVAPLATGRQRYNCTAPTGEAGRYYWYSHPWVILPPGQTLTD